VGQLTCELKYATFSDYQRGQHQQGRAEKEASMIVREALAPAVLLVCKVLHLQLQFVPGKYLNYYCYFILRIAATAVAMHSALLCIMK